MNTLRTIGRGVLVVAGFGLAGALGDGSTASAATPCPTTEVSLEPNAGLQLNGNAASMGSPGAFLRLTAANPWESGSVFTTAALDLADGASFSTSFAFRISRGVDGLDGADGLVFVVQNVSNSAGSSGGGIGYEFVEKSIGVEFDTYDNGAGYGDSDGNHVGIDVAGAIASVETRTLEGTGISLEDGQPKFAWVDYNGATDLLEVRIANSASRPASAFLERTIDLPEVLGASSGFLGFTSATGGDYENHDILDWTYRGCYEPVGRRSASADEAAEDESSTSRGGRSDSSATPVEDNDVIATAAHDSGRSVIAEGLRAPAQVSGEAALLLANALLAVGFVFVAFPAALFDSTLETNYDEVIGWFRRRPRPEGQPKRERGRRMRFMAFGLAALAAAVLFIVLDPKAKLDRSTVMLAIGLAAATVVSTLLSAAVSGSYLRRNGGEFGQLRAYPGALWFGAACVAVSRVAGFLPGYLYGSVGGFERDKEPDRVHKGKSAALGIVAGAAIAVIAWVAWIPIRDAATDNNPGSVVLVLDALLASIAVLSFQSMLFSLIPVRGLPGAKLWSWNRAVWGVFTAVAGFGFLHVLVHPASKYQGSVVVMVVLFIAFALLSVAFWGYFRFRQPPKTT